MFVVAIVDGSPKEHKEISTHLCLHKYINTFFACIYIYIGVCECMCVCVYGQSSPIWNAIGFGAEFPHFPLMESFNSFGLPI